MDQLYEKEIEKTRLWKKGLSVLLAVILAFGTIVTLLVVSSCLPDRLAAKAMLSAYAAEIVDMHGVTGMDEAAMEDDHVIALQKKDGSTTAYSFAEPITFTDKDGKRKAKDLSIEKQTDKKLKAAGYTYTNGQNDYRVNLSPDPQKGVQTAYGGASVTIAPVPAASASAGAPGTVEKLGETLDAFTYENAANGLPVTVTPQLSGVNQEIPVPDADTLDGLSFTLQTENCIPVQETDGSIAFVNPETKETVQKLELPAVTSNADGTEECAGSYELIENEDGSYTITIRANDDAADVYPGVMTLAATGNVSNYRDAGVYSAKASTCYGKEATCCFGRASEYGYGRVLNMFTMPDAIKKGAKINSAYMWQRETTGRTASTYVRPYIVNASWAEGDVTWSNKPGYDTSSGMTRKNINAKCTDDPDNSNWYKFNITPAVQKWTDGTKKNYGVVFVSEEETDKAYNWRAFTSKQYSSSAMRPYTVINYTNDTTAPTITGVSGNPTAWTKENVTLTVNGATDSGSGLHATPYSFSTTKGSYAWQAGKTKTFSANTTVYIYVRDAVGNIRLASTQTISKIDKAAPAAPSVSGNPTAWTKDNVTLTASATDNASGVAAYSFSTTAGVYAWQTGKTKAFSANATVYVYAKDAAGNISPATTVQVTKIDKAAPVISDVAVTKNSETNKTTVTITAKDAASGIAGYSFDGGQTYQAANSKTLDTVSDPISIAVKDNTGNVATKVTDAILPVFYTDGALVGILDPNTDRQEKLQYKIGEDGDWTNYTVPFAVPLYETSTVYARIGSSNSVITETVTPDTASLGAYTEANTDFSLSYKNIAFDFTRSYSSAKRAWFFATDSHITIVNDSVLEALLPDGTKTTFIKTGDTTYTNEASGYSITTGDTGFTIQLDDVQYTYGTDGRLLSISNPYDDTITIARTDSAITVTDGAGRAYTLGLDAGGKLVSATDPAGSVLTYTYDAGGNLTQVVDQAGVTLGQYAYTNGVLTKSMDKSINYDKKGRVESFVYDSGAYLNYTYDDENKTVAAESSVETATSETYNDALLTVSATDEDGSTTEYTYDDANRLLTQTADGHTTTYAYDAKGRVLSEVSDDEDAENTYYTYDQKGHVIRQQTGKAYTYSVYTDKGETALTATLKEGYTGDIPEVFDESLTCFDTVRYTYDNGLLVKSVNSKTGETAVYTYDVYGNTVNTSTTEAQKDSTTVSKVDCTYDVLGNLLTSTSDAETEAYTYDKAGRTLLAKDKDGCTRTIYDGLGRTVQEITPEDYDASKDGLPESNTYTDDTAGHTYVYAENGALTSETNRLGQTTRYYYNDIGCKVREEFDLYKFYYLNHGELYQVKVAGVTTVSYSYSTDGKFLLMQENYANDDTIRYAYNENGDVTAQYKNNNAKPYVTYTYNADKELAEKVNTDTGLRYVYGENNNVDVYKTADGTLVQSYTETETEADEEATTEAKTTVMESHFGLSYTSVSKEKSIAYTAGANTAAYSFQTSGSEEDEKLASDSVTFNGMEALSTAYTYDKDGSITDKAVGLQMDGMSDTMHLARTYDKAGRITGAGFGTEHQEQTYTYDEQGQLVRVNDTYAVSDTNVYTYDNRGNITQKQTYDFTRGDLDGKPPRETTTFTYVNNGWKDQLITVNGTELTYDANGNVLTYGDRAYTWNTGRNLASITDGSNTYAYTYDENGVRTSKTINGKTTHFNTKDGVILSQSDGTNTMYFQYNTNGAPMGFLLNGVQYFYITTPEGDVLAITDEMGAVLAMYNYDEWGSLQSIDTIVPDQDEYMAIAKASPLRYRGYYYDNETGYYYLQSRYYDPSICRFINSDIPEVAQMTKGVPVGTNAFAYCNNDPVNNIDILGYKSVSVSWISTPIDIAISIFCSGAAISYNVVSQGLKYATKKFGMKKAYNILMGIVPKVKGIYSKFYTAIRKVIYKVASKAISKTASYTVQKLIKAITHIASKGKWNSNEVYYSICMFFSFGAFIAGLLDFVTDGKINGRIQI